MKNKILAQRVKDLRKKKGLSQEELSENAGLSLRTIQRIESGETEPTGDTLKRIASALQVSPEELIIQAKTGDHGFLKAMNLSALAFIVFPLLGILVPLIMWVSKKDKLKDINTAGKSIINFEITWTILLATGVILNRVILAQKINSTGIISLGYFETSRNFMLIFLVGMYVLNSTFVIFNTYRIQNTQALFYQPKINFV